MISGRAFPPLFFGPLTGILELNFVTGKFGTSSRATRKGLFIFLFFIFYFILFFFSLSHSLHALQWCTQMINSFCGSGVFSSFLQLLIITSSLLILWHLHWIPRLWNHSLRDCFTPVDRCYLL